MMAAPFQQGLGDWTLSFNVQSIQVRRIDLHYGKRDPASMSYSEAMGGVTDVVETGQHDALQRGGPM
jgi:hypothetical protein